ncbi:MAG: alpha/beta hydrolase [Idiomarina sp.]|nr:alpha/beta hydrolase [Idiomarina sp.]
MKKLLLPLAIGSALSLVGCGSGDEAPVTETEVSVAASRVVFDPSNGALPVPTNILLSGSVDGTLNLPVEDASDIANPQVAINGLDGWGTHSTLTFNFSLPVDENGEKVTIEAASLEAQGSIRVFETIQGGSAVSEQCAAANPAAVCAVTGELEHNTDFTVKATGEGSVAVVPLRPFKPKTGYLVVLTDNIQDSLGRDVKPSQTYTLMKRNADEKPVSGDESALSLQRLVNSYEGALVQSEYGVDPESVIYSSNFTTQSVGDVLGMTKTLLGLAQDQGMGPQITFNAPTATLDTYVSGSISDPTLLAVAQNTNVYSESIALPYYLHTPQDASDNSHLTGSWEAKCDSPVTIVGGIESGAIPNGTLGVTQDAIEADKAAVIQSLVEACIAQPDGIDLPGVDEDRHLTRYNPVPEQQSVQNAPVFMTVPAYEAPPAGGWPVVTFQHGIGSSAAESAPAIATQLSAAGFITIAIDHPLHGGRGFDTDGDNEIDVTATGQENVTTYMNLQSLLTTRDNLRQSVADLLALRLGLNNLAASGAPVNPQNVYFLGHSLGAIAGTAFAQLSNQPSGSDALDAAFEVQGASLAMPGGSLANFLLASDSFGPTIKSNLLYSANAEFKAAANEAIAGGTSLTDFYAGFMAQASDDDVAQINATFEQFAFAAQTVIDSGDPVNYAADLAENTPVFLLEADGDTVIPNSVENKPLAGTQPLVGLMQLSDARPPESTVPVQSEDGAPVSAYASFLGGSHSSLLDPTASAAVTAEMQTQILTWFGSGLLTIPVDNEEVVE